MAKYGISREGVEALRQLSSDMGTLNASIEQSGIKLHHTIAGYEEGLGVYAEEIEELIFNVNAAQADGRESVETLKTQLDKLASNIEGLINMGL